MTEPRFYSTGLHPHPVDLWAIAVWNDGIQRARDAYNTTMNSRGFGDRSTPCTRCQKPTLHATGYCHACRRVLTNREQTPWTKCDMCTTRTVHESGLCYYCRINQDRTMRAVENWYVCKRPGCGRATRNAACVCTRCQSGHLPNGPGHHWSLRWRNP